MIVWRSHGHFRPLNQVGDLSGISNREVSSVSVAAVRASYAKKQGLFGKSPCF
jgi:hypothetical protein